MVSGWRSDSFLRHSREGGNPEVWRTPADGRTETRRLNRAFPYYILPILSFPRKWETQRRGDAEKRGERKGGRAGLSESGFAGLKDFQDSSGVRFGWASACPHPKLAEFPATEKIAIRAKRNPENPPNPINPDSDKGARSTPPSGFPPSRE